MKMPSINIIRTSHCEKGQKARGRVPIVGRASQKNIVKIEKGYWK